MQLLRLVSVNELLSVLVIFSFAINYTECIDQGNSSVAEFSQDNADFGENDDFSDSSLEQL